METLDDDLYERAKALLEPGDIQLDGLILHTDYTSEAESRLHETTLEVGDVIAEFADKGDWYVFSGNDDPRFGLNQHQGLTIAEDEFVWECQQLLRDGTFDVVFYYEATDEQEELCEAVSDLGYRVTGVRGD
ncbi:DUF5778 family protein [Halomarina ordinaria]|uniref:DUF5778 family protein n=1 Tax=Halomarina ordinaria TaxID=3033939 RepID=A0ABD5U3Z9_9EURY|nr:DUF5778 family protein [Halomarina sp. PSRA2]